MDWGKAYTGPWETSAIWQYTSTGRLSGYGGNLDLNHAYMTRDGWNKYARGDSGNVSGADKPSGKPDNISKVSTLENDDYKVTVERK